MRVAFAGLVKRYGEARVVDDITLAIEEGEFFTLLGPSGCGKTTLLRMVAGFTQPDAGDILFGERSILAVAPHRREIGMVFQSYALFPQMTVADNVAYGLRARKTPAAETRDRVAEVLRNVQLEELADRYPRQLSGGQQQRVALARAMVISPRVLLMDEPLSNLDARLRVSMREEIRRIQQERGITTLYVTHDQEEAMAVSDRIAILNAGTLQQVGRPKDIYFAPVNRFTAEFMGACNLLSARARGLDPGNGLLRVEVDGQALWLTPRALPGDGQLTLLLRPDWITLCTEPEPGGENRFPAVVRAATFLGASASYQMEALGQTLRVDGPGQGGLLQPGDQATLCFDPARPALLPA